MYKREPPRILSAEKFAGVPLTSLDLLLSSDPLAWNGLTVRAFYSYPQGQLVVPPVLESMVIIHSQGVTRSLQGKAGRPFQGSHFGVGTTFLIPPGVPTEWNWQEVEGYSEILHLCLDAALLPTVAVEAADVDPAQVELMERIAFEDPLIYYLGLALLAELQSGGIAGRLYAESLAHTLAVHLLRHYAVFPPPVRELRYVLSRPIVQRVTDYINDHLTHDLSLAELAGLAHLSPYHFARLFKRTTGQTLHQYVIQRRVEAAKRLLLTGQLTVAEVAMLVGFHDQSHLYRHFKRLIGVPPSQLLPSRQKLQLAEVLSQG